MVEEREWGRFWHTENSLWEMIMKASLNSCSGDQYREFRFPSTNWLLPRSRACVQMPWAGGGDFASQAPELRSGFTCESARIGEFKRWGCPLTSTTEPGVLADLGSQRTAPQHHEARVKRYVCHRALGMLTHLSGPSSLHFHTKIPALPPTSRQGVLDFLRGVQDWALGTGQLGVVQIEGFFPPSHVQVRATSGQQGRNEMN